MSNNRTALNGPDIAIGVGLLILLPLIAAALHGSSSGENSRGPASKALGMLALSRAEIEIHRDAYSRMFGNGRFFMVQAGFDEKYRSENEGLARSVFQTAQKGLLELRQRAKTGPLAADTEPVLGEIDDLIRKVDGQLKQLSAGQGAPSGESPARAPEEPSK